MQQTQSDLDYTPSISFIQLLRTRFFLRDDRAAILAPWGSPCPVDATNRLGKLIEGHLCGSSAPPFSVRWLKGGQPQQELQGPFRVGSYAPDADGNTRWTYMDIDGPGHEIAVADPHTAALVIKTAFDAHGIPMFIEKSGGGAGWHLWVFFEPVVSAAKARRLAMALIPSDIPLAKGGFADPQKGLGIEVFPKQTQISPEQYGSIGWMPWWYAAGGDTTQFHELNGDGTLHPYMPEKLIPIDEAAVDRVLEETERPTVLSPTASSSSGKPHSTPQHDDDIWREWRQRALDTLRLEEIYGDWLTGKTASGGWLECRVPWSPSGDRNPSGGVADGTGEAERGSFHDFTSGETCSVFDFIIKQGRAVDFASARRIIAEMSGVAIEEVRCPSPIRLPSIQLNNRQLRDVIDDTWKAIHKANAPNPSLFVRAGDLVHIAVIDKRLGIKTHTVDSIFGHAARAADWVRVQSNGSTSVSPSRDVAKDLLSYPDRVLPALEAIVTTPVFSASGRLLHESGYYPEARLQLASASSLRLPSIPESPSPSDIAGARQLICDELLGDFPFVSGADRAHAVAAMLLPLVRRMIDGVTPLHVVSAPTAGSGKGLLCDVISICTEGRSCEAQPISGNEEEIRKMITSQLSRAHPLILLDNAKERKRLDSPSLAAVLTAFVWVDRILKESRTISLPNRALWLLTGNNPQFSMELARRSIRIRIDPKVDQPWRREGFRHKNLRAWTTQNRSELLAALFVMVRAWQTAGRPMHQIELGTFENWSQIIGGILSVAGIPGFLSNLDDFYASSDAEGQMWCEFVTAWQDGLGNESKRIKEINSFCYERDLLTAVRGEKNERSQETRLGYALQSVRDRVFGGYRIVLDKDSYGRGKTYRLEEAGGGKLETV